MIFRIFLKFSKRRRAVPLWPIWTIMVAAKLDHSRVLVTKFHQNRSTLKGRSAGQSHTHRDCAPTAVPNTPSSECPRASIGVRRRDAGSIKISRRPSCCCSSAIAGIAIGANFRIHLLRQFCSNRVEFLQYTGDTDAKNDGPEF